MVTVDLTAPNVYIGALKANHRIRSKAQTSQIVKNTSHDGFVAAVAVNADFFEPDGKTVDLCIQDGEIVTPPIKYPVFGVTKENTPFIGSVELGTTIIAAVGDTLIIAFSLSPITTLIHQAVGGIPRIVRDGEVAVEWKQNSFNLERHPRTTVGYSQDQTKLFIVTVDGRQPGHSDGMRLEELANFMLKVGAYQALNLDGGGSTTMVIFGKVVNRPSDVTGEREVGNALVIWCNSFN